VVSGHLLHHPDDRWVLKNKSHFMKHIFQLVNYYKNAITSKHNQHFLPWRFDLYQKPSSGKVCSILLPVLVTIVTSFAALLWQEPEEESNKLLLMKVSDRDRNVKVKMLDVFEVIAFLWPPYVIGGPLYFCPVVSIFFFLWSPYVIGRPYIFSSCYFFFLLSSFFFSSPNLSGRRLDVYHTLAHGVTLVRI